MASISATASASALRNLQAINKELTATQNRVSTGLKVASARDNASVWATAQNIRADVAKEDTLASSLTISKGRADLTLEALDKIADVLSKMKTIADSIEESNGDATLVAKNTALTAELAPYQSQLKAIAAGTAFAGENWLATTTGSSIVLSTNNGSDVTYSFAPEKLYDGSTGTLAAAIGLALGDPADTAAATAKKDIVNDAIAVVKAYTTKLSGLSDTIDMQQTFVSKMSSIRQEAISRLVDADMTAESAKLAALQVREQLTYQTLATINSSSQNILRLFQ